MKAATVSQPNCAQTKPVAAILEDQTLREVRVKKFKFKLVKFYLLIQIEMTGGRADSMYHLLPRECKIQVGRNIFQIQSLPSINPIFRVR